jgi:carboxypeptidase family protein
VPAGNGTGLSGVVATGSKVLATSEGEVWQLSLTSASPQVTPTLNPPQLTAIAAGPAGNLWAVGSAGGGKTRPDIINAPGIGQGGIIVTTGASGATVTWTGPANGSGGTNPSGRFATGGLPQGSYTVTASLPGCRPGVTTADVTAGYATTVHAPIRC